jgi:predicted PhzF superfamily epimerase YddE/YHI9
MQIFLLYLNGSFRFTPAREVELCGHATLSAAHVLFETKRIPLSDSITFRTCYSGDLVASATPDMNIELSFPATPIAKYDFSSQELQDFVTAFKIKESDVLFTGKSIYDLFVEIVPEAFYGLGSINSALVEKFGGRGVFVTTLGGKRTGNPEHLPYDFLSRGFFPLYGITEDPVTGFRFFFLPNKT